MHSHYIILAGQFSAVQRASLIQYIHAEMCDWFNYTADAWLVCTSDPATKLVAALNLRFPGTYHMVVKLEPRAMMGGSLPEEAWTWLRRHDLVAGLGPNK